MNRVYQKRKKRKLARQKYGGWNGLGKFLNQMHYEMSQELKQQLMRQ